MPFSLLRLYRVSCCYHVVFQGSRKKKKPPPLSVIDLGRLLGPNFPSDDAQGCSEDDKEKAVKQSRASGDAKDTPKKQNSASRQSFSTPRTAQNNGVDSTRTTSVRPAMPPASPLQPAHWCPSGTSNIAKIYISSTGSLV